MPSTPLHAILTQHFDTSDVAFTKIDGEIASLQENIRALLAFRNTFTLTYRLPPEVLTRIFLQCTSWPDQYKALRWIGITHVSQHWRNVAIGSPRLWSWISNSYPKPIAEEAPLFLHWRGKSSLGPQFINPSLFRSQSLTFDLESAHWIELSVLTSPAPLLDSFCIMRDGPSHNRNAPTVTISDNLFAGITPRLRHLELSGCSFDINSFLFKGLTSLKLENPRRKFLAADLLNTLRGLPHLTSLTLSGVDLNDAVPPSPNLEVVTLSSLESLCICGKSLNQQLHILSHLYIPANSSLHFYSETKTGDAFAALFDFLSANKAARQPSSTIIVEHIELLFDQRIRKLDLRVHRTKPGIRADFLEFVLLGPWGRTSQSLEMLDTPEVAILFSYLPLAALSSFRTNCTLGVGIWSSVFGTLPGLKHISGSGDGAVNVLSAIVNDFKTSCSPVHGEYGPQDDNNANAAVEWKGTETPSTPNPLPVVWSPLFPKLEGIHLYRTNFPQSRDDLVTVLRARKEVERGIKEIDIQRCPNVDKALLESLDGVVNVTWDGWIETPKPVRHRHEFNWLLDD
ncbi:hypothetical protein BDN72DRAFT_850181 [Pluteus cervinus]|uniref:Uncharacterized protein n=1 Tax=Pluteus cervinus TaxID=181527 RepID=A0ACD3A661_9AGAR|nr:hypothetical protein BDN72DRAFT_850181 [Pluteus cervinus]